MEITAEIWASFFTQVTPAAGAISVGLAVIVGLVLGLLTLLDYGVSEAVINLIRGAVGALAITGIIWLGLFVSLFVAWLVGMVF